MLDESLFLTARNNRGGGAAVGILTTDGRNTIGWAEPPPIFAKELSARPIL